MFLEVFNMLYKNYVDCIKKNKTTPDECFVKNYKLFVQDEEPDININNKIIIMIPTIIIINNIICRIIAKIASWQESILLKS